MKTSEEIREEKLKVMDPAGQDPTYRLNTRYWSLAWRWWSLRGYHGQAARCLLEAVSSSKKRNQLARS